MPDLIAHFVIPKASRYQEKMISLWIMAMPMPNSETPYVKAQERFNAAIARSVEIRDELEEAHRKIRLLESEQHHNAREVDHLEKVCERAYKEQQSTVLRGVEPPPCESEKKCGLRHCDMCDRKARLCRMRYVDNKRKLQKHSRSAEAHMYSSYLVCPDCCTDRKIYNEPRPYCNPAFLEDHSLATCQDCNKMKLNGNGGRYYYGHCEDCESRSDDYW